MLTTWKRNADHRKMTGIQDCFQSDTPLSHLCHCYIVTWFPCSKSHLMNKLLLPYPYNMSVIMQRCQTLGSGQGMRGKLTIVKEEDTTIVKNKPEKRNDFWNPSDRGKGWWEPILLDLVFPSATRLHHVHQIPHPQAIALLLFRNQTT